MNPCRENRERLAWLALEGVVPEFHKLESAHEGPEQKQSLRAHLEVCEPCRQYLAELSGLAGRLQADAAGKGNGPVASECSHQRLLRALDAGGPTGARRRLAREHRLGWRAAWGALGVAVVLVIGLLWSGSSSRRATVAAVERTHAPAEARAKSLPPPSVAEYSMAATRSLDELDDLLTRQSRRDVPPAPRLSLSSLLGSSQ
jgi:hypothetical protein